MLFSDAISAVDIFAQDNFKMLIIWPNMVIIHVNNKMHFPGLAYTTTKLTIFQAIT